jgi:hypothetical protein
MIKKNTIKQALFSVTLVITALVIASCGFDQKPKDTKVVAEEQNDEKFDSNKQEKDAQFLVNAAEINLEERRNSTSEGIGKNDGRCTH